MDSNWRKIGNKVVIDGQVLFIGDYALGEFCLVDENEKHSTIRLDPTQYELEDIVSIKTATRMHELDLELMSLLKEEMTDTNKLRRGVLVIELASLCQEIVKKRIAIYKKENL